VEKEINFVVSGFKILASWFHPVIALRCHPSRGEYQLQKIIEKFEEV
jgi:hypothetical protein